MDRLVPKSILIVGSGVFGLSTAWALSKRREFAETKITVIDDTRGDSFPPADSASIDTSRVIRADYSDPYYAELAAEAQKEWRKQSDDELGGQGRYFESGLVLTANLPSADGTALGRLSGMDYTRNSWKNVVEIAQKEGYPAGKMRALETPAALREQLRTEKHPGDWGYINELSGWADAGKGMSWLFKKVKDTGRVEFVDANVEQLVTEESRVVGVRLENGNILNADLVIVAAGAWTGQLVDLRGRVEATGHVLGYVDISQEEFDVLSKQPVILNLTTGLFVIPPSERVLKVARHSFGYLNPVTVKNALPLSPSETRNAIVISLPATSRNSSSSRLPEEANRDLRRALQDLVPLKGLEERPWKHQRLCWYSDTKDGDWLVDHHPGWKGLFIATGDSGHGYKFLPVLGDKIADCVLGRKTDLTEKWRWKASEDEQRVGREIDGKFIGLITVDGSRGGEPGMVLQDELAKASA